MHAFTWEYDAAGNRTAQVRNGTPTYYDYNTLNELTHEVTGNGHTYYTYDADGQLASRQDGGGTTEFAWDFESRMREVVLPDETTLDYRYILGSQRWRKRKFDEEERTDFIYDGEKVAEEHDYCGANQATYTHAGSSIYAPLLAQRTDSSSAWFLQDALGSTMALLDSDEALLLQVLYDAWGNELLSNGNGQTPYRYVGAYGYYRDIETDLLYLWMRYYDPRVGRFVRRDPARMPFAGWYVYAADHPERYTDATGRHGEGNPDELRPWPPHHGPYMPDPWGWGETAVGLGELLRLLARLGERVRDLGEEALRKLLLELGLNLADALRWMVQVWGPWSKCMDDCFSTIMGRMYSVGSPIVVQGYIVSMGCLYWWAGLLMYAVPVAYCYGWCTAQASLPPPPGLQPSPGGPPVRHDWPRPWRPKWY